jgi:hypothetical protein
MDIVEPRIRFCWECGKKLQGSHYATVVAFGHERIVHKTCREKALDDIQEEHFNELRAEGVIDDYYPDFGQESLDE